MIIPKDTKNHVALIKADDRLIARVEAEVYAVIYSDGQFHVHAYSTAGDDTLYFVDSVIMGQE